MRFAVAGQEIDFELHGDGRGIVFVHGLTADRRLLVDAFEPAFAGGATFRRVYLDLPGHGGSPPHPAALSADGLVDILAQALLSLGGERPALVAHQYGAYLALGAAREVSLGGLFLVNPIVQPDIPLRALPPQRIVARDDGLAFVDDFERATFEGEIAVQTAANLERYRTLLDPAHRAVDRELLATVRSRYALSGTWSAAIGAIDGPVEVVCGRDDYWGGYADALALVRAHERCRYTVLPDAGPYVPIDAPGALRERFEGWLGELSLSPR